MPHHARRRSPLRSAWVAGLLVAALSLPLASCGGDDDAPASSSPSGSAPGSPSGEAAPTAGTAPSTAEEPDALTPPGTQLSLDEPANVPLTFGDERALARLEIVDLERVPPTDLPPDLRPEGPGEWDLTYVRLRATLLEGSGTGVMNVSVGMNIEGEAQGTSVLPVILWERFRPCYDAPPPFGRNGVRDGASWKACVPILSRRSEPLDAIVYTNPSNRYKNPIRWVI